MRENIAHRLFNIQNMTQRVLNMNTRWHVHTYRRKHKHTAHTAHFFTWPMPPYVGFSLTTSISHSALELVASNCKTNRGRLSDRQGERREREREDKCSRLLIDGFSHKDSLVRKDPSRHEQHSNKLARQNPSVVTIIITSQFWPIRPNSPCLCGLCCGERR